MCIIAYRAIAHWTIEKKNDVKMRSGVKRPRQNNVKIPKNKLRGFYNEVLSCATSPHILAGFVLNDRILSVQVCNHRKFIQIFMNFTVHAFE